MTIRLLHEEDWRIWKDFRIQSVKHFPLAFASTLEEEQKSPDHQFQEWLRRHTVYGAFIEERLIGNVGFLKQQLFKERHRGILFGMEVLPEYQRQGVAETLMNSIIRHAKNYVLQLHLKVLSTNETAIRLYLRHGFERYGTEKRSLKVDGRFYDEDLMVLPFDGPLSSLTPMLVKKTTNNED